MHLKQSAIGLAVMFSVAAGIHAAPAPLVPQAMPGDTQPVD